MITKMKFIFSCALYGFISVTPLDASEIYNFTPPKFDDSQEQEFPITYLKKFRVKDTSQKLKPSEIAALKRFFITISEQNKKLLEQDMALDTNTPIYVLLKTNCPSLGSVEVERGAIVFLGDVEKFLQQLAKSDLDK